jgi:hypothetical protein
LKPETKLWHKVKKFMPEISFTVSSALYKDEKLYDGKDILQLAACGLRLEACRSGLDLIYNYFKRL